MFSKRSVFNCLLTLALLAGLGACQQQGPETGNVPLATPTHQIATQTNTPDALSQGPIPPPANCRDNILDPGEIIHAVHMGGNWGTNFESENKLPDDYYEYLEELNVNWVGISVALHFDDSMDSTVERKYADVVVPTFTDDFLRELIRSFHQHDICVYITLAFEPFEAEASERPVYRWQLGGATPQPEFQQILPEDWPWAIDHPDHERFVAEFWQTYAEQAAHFGQLAEDEGVALFSLGTETEGLFRTRPSEFWPNDFKDELQAMVAAVREVYSGPLTYDLAFWIFTEPEYRGGSGSYYLWEDLDLDVIGLSAYFPLADCPPATAFSVGSLEERWERVFQDYLLPLHEENPDRPIFFTEFGYSDSLLSVVNASTDSFVERVVEDRDGSGFDDGDEMQANIYQALFNVMERHPGVVNGLFLWDMWMVSDLQWTFEIKPLRGIWLRGRMAEDIIRTYYGAEPRSTTPTPIPPSEDISDLIIGETCEIYDDHFSIEWWDAWTWDGEVDTQSTQDFYSGENAIRVTLGPSGGVNLYVGPQIDVSRFTWLVFYINRGEEPDQQIGVQLSDQDGQAPPPLDISTYIDEDQPDLGGWSRVTIPLVDLVSDGETVAGIGFVDLSGSGEATFYLDEIRFTVSEP